MSIIAEINQAIQEGRAKLTCELISSALDAGYPAEQILNEGMLSAMSVIGEKFKANDVFIPEVLVSARAMNMGMEILKPILNKTGVDSIGTAVIGTVQGDMHDIGKNLVKMMLEGRGIEVIDLGVNVSAETFLQAAEDNNAHLICCSALLTTTMGELKTVVEYFERSGKREKFKIMIGGAPISQAYCDTVRADYYAPDAASASDVAFDYFAGNRVN